MMDALWVGGHTPFTAQLCDRMLKDGRRVYTLCDAASLRLSKLRIYMSSTGGRNGLQRDIFSECITLPLAINDTRTPSALYPPEPFELWLTDASIELLLHQMPYRQWMEHLCVSHTISSIHILLCMYNPLVLNYAEFLEHLCDVAPVHISHTPVPTHDTLQIYDDILSIFVNRLMRFKTWVENRIPHYFDDQPLNISVGKDACLHRIPLGDVAACVYSNSLVTLDEHTETYICNKKTQHFSEMLALLNRQIPSMALCAVTDTKSMNLIDCLFEEILTEAFPYRNTPAVLHRVLKQSAHKKIHIDKGGDIFDCTCVARKRKTAWTPVAHSLCWNGKETMHYYSIGQGECIIIVNAFGAKKEAWEKFTQVLSQCYRVIFWESRGIFEDYAEGLPISNFYLLSQTEIIEKILLQEKINECHIIAWCSGVKSAVKFAIRKPEKVKSLTFLSGDFAPYEGYQGNRIKFMQNMEFITQLIENNPRMLSYYLRSIYAGQFNKAGTDKESRLDDSIFEIIPDVYRKMLLSQYNHIDQAIRFFKLCMEYYEHSIEKELRELNQSVLLLSAQNDVVAPLEQSSWASKKIHNARHITLKATTHLMILEQYEDIVLLMEQHKRNEFLKMYPPYRWNEYKAGNQAPDDKPIR